MSTILKQKMIINANKSGNHKTTSTNTKTTKTTKTTTTSTSSTASWKKK